MKMIEDLRVKHIVAFVSHEIGKQVTAITTIGFNQDIWFDTDKNDERIEDSDYQLVAIFYYYYDENNNRVDDSGVFRWDIYHEELSYVGTTEEFGELDM